MTDHELADVLRVYEEAARRSGVERQAYLDAACGSNARLRREVDALLAEPSASDGGFLESPPWQGQALAPGQRLGPYEVTSLIGAGGMGEVYRARDTRLGRAVAIKVLPAATVGDAARRTRFEREAKIIAQLSHPHICTVHDVGEHQGAAYLVMELLTGQTLAERLRGGPLPLEQALTVASEIAAALAAAHRQNVIHRDLKPGNVMLTEAGAKLLDFGLAKAVGKPPAQTSGAATAPHEEMTGAGVMLGTVGYMSPEQVRGEELDARADLFSLGVVLYEMATGRRPFQGATSGEVFGEILHKAPTAPARLNPDVPPELERIVNTLLEKDRARRYQSASDLGVDLKRLLHDRERGRAAAGGGAGPSPVPSLAVLPFANLSADKENEYFSDGLAEDIMNALTQVPGLRVTARTSAFAFRGKEQDVRDIGARLNVEHILEGSVRRSGNHIRVTAQLVKTSDGYHLWSQRFDREMTDVFAIQDEISRAIVERLRGRLSTDRPLVKRRTDNVEAYNLYLKGRYQLFRFTPEGIAKSKEYYEQAIGLDPDYALAWHGLAGFYDILGMSGQMPPRAANAQADHATRRALQLDDQLAEAHAMMGALRASEFDWNTAEREFGRAVALDAGSADVLRWYEHYYLGPMKRLDDAVAGYVTAVERDPLSPSLQAQLGYVYCLKRDWHRAIAHGRAALELDPRCWAYLLLGSCYFHLGKHDDAIRAMETQAEVLGRSAFALGSLGWLRGLTGFAGGARELLAELHARAREAYVPSWSFGVIHAGLGDLDTAYDWFERAVDEHEPLMLHFHVHPNYSFLHTHPRFPVLMQKMNLAP